MVNGFILIKVFPSLDGDGRGRKLASRYGQRAHRRPDIYRSSGRLACDGFWCFWCKHPRFCHNGNNGRHIVTNKRLQFSSLSCLGQPQWGGVRSGTYLATLHHLSRQFCMTFNLTLRLSEGGRGRESLGGTTLRAYLSFWVGFQPTRLMPECRGKPLRQSIAG